MNHLLLSSENFLRNNPLMGSLSKMLLSNELWLLRLSLNVHHV